MSSSKGPVIPKADGQKQCLATVSPRMSLGDAPITPLPFAWAFQPTWCARIWHMKLHLWVGRAELRSWLCPSLSPLQAWSADQHPPDWAARECPKKKSFFPAEGGLLVPLLENYRHLDRWLWVFGVEMNWIQFCCSHWVGKSPFIQLTAVPSHLPQYLFIDFKLKTCQLQKKFFLGKNSSSQHCLGR